MAIKRARTGLREKTHPRLNRSALRQRSGSPAKAELPVNRGRITWAHRAGPWALFLCALLLTLSSASPTSAAVVTRAPYLQLATDDSIVIRWRTDIATDSQVDYGSAPGSLTQSVYDPALTTEHIVTLTGLSPDARYFYSIGSSTEVLAGDDADHFFYTNPIPGTRRPIRAWLIGDTGYGSQNQADVRDAYYTYTGSTRTDLWLHVGDVSQSTGTDAQYQTEFFDMYPGLLRQSVFWPTFGNHDAAHANSSTQSGPYYENYTLPTSGEAGGFASGTEAYYSFDYANIHFVVLNSSDVTRTTGSAMLTWLATDLADTAQDWIIAYWHHPPYSKGSHDSDTEINMIEMREYTLPILEDYGVDLAFTGHSHSYERTYLIDGHYGDSTTFGEIYKVDGGDGREGGDGAYQKTQLGPDPHSGTVYTVAGTGGQTYGGDLDHPAMYISWNVLGSVVLDINGDRLDAIFLDSTGSIRDLFTLIKGVDQDEDGVPDDQDNCLGLYNPGQEDSDSDGLGNACDNCPGFDDNVDGDSDGVANGCDVCPGFDDNVDGDSDGVADGCDVCPGFDDNVDGDSDGLADGCDVCPGFDDNVDGDSDGLADGCDNCPDNMNPVQEDADSDGEGDICDTCPNDPNNDVDGDNRCADVDNCPDVFNPNQRDDDGDGRGNVCDATQGVAELKRLTVAGVADRMSSVSYIMNVTSAPVAGTSGVCPAGKTGSLGFWSFRAPTKVPVLLTMNKTFNGGSGQYDVELTWTGLSTLFEIYRNTSPVALIEPGKLWQTTNLCNETDQDAYPFDILFYSVIE
jgi:hypothetical protein